MLWTLETTRYGRQIERHKLNVVGNMMVDDMVQSKKDTPLKLLFLEMLFRCLFFRLKEPVKVQKVKLRPVPFLGGGGGGIVKKVGQSDDAKRRKQGDGLMLKISFAK